MVHPKVKKSLKKNHIASTVIAASLNPCPVTLRVKSQKYQNENHVVTKLELQLYKANGGNNEYTNFSLMYYKNIKSLLSKTLKLVN